MTLRQQHQAGQNKDLLLKKVNPTAATGVSQVKLVSRSLTRI